MSSSSNNNNSSSNNNNDNDNINININYGWEDLPKEILQIIRSHLSSRIDVYRFRAVCHPWRSSVSPPHKHSLPLKLPNPICLDSFLTQFTICRIQLPNHDASSWITKVDESINGELQLMTPLSNLPINRSDSGLNKTINLLEFRLIELMRGYNLRLASSCSVYGINKVLLFPKPHIMSSDNDSEIGILLIFHEGKLAFWKSRDEELKLLDENNFNYDDVMVYKGQYYVVDRCGTVSWIDSSLNLVQYSPPLFGCGTKKNLVESCGELYVVDRYLDQERWRLESAQYQYINHKMNRVFNRIRRFPQWPGRTVDVKVYKLDEEWGRWIDLASLGNRSFVLGNECCFSVSSTELGGRREGNCVYFVDPKDDDIKGGCSGYDISVFNLSTRNINKLAHVDSCFQIFCPPRIGTSNSSINL